MGALGNVYDQKVYTKILAKALHLNYILYLLLELTLLMPNNSTACDNIGDGSSERSIFSWVSSNRNLVATKFLHLFELVLSILPCVVMIITLTSLKVSMLISDKHYLACI